MSRSKAPPQKNVIKIIYIILFDVIIFYILYYYIFIFDLNN